MVPLSQFRYFIHLAYHGANYAGWQLQHNALTVQEKLENAISAILKCRITVTGCGRTDAGVSASDYYCHFDSVSLFSTSECEQLSYKLNRFLPQDIVIFSIFQVNAEAHARYSATSREYNYVLITRKNPFLYQSAYFIHGKIDIKKMNDCANLLLGRQDFKCFSKVNTDVNNFYCTVASAEFKIIDAYSFVFTIRADRFLRNMVRAIVGTLLDVGKGKIDANEFIEILNSRNRCNAGYSVPAQGLTLSKVQYPEWIKNIDDKL